MELIAYLGPYAAEVLTPEVVTNILIGLAIVGGVVLLITISRR